MNVVSVASQKRESIGTKGAAQARRDGFIPAVLYGNSDPVHINVTWSEVRHAIYTPNFVIVNLNVDGKDVKCIVKDTQFDAVNDSIVHIDFLRLSNGVPVKVDVPIRFTGTSVGVKNGGKLIQQVRKLKIKSIPENLVDELKVDISHLDLGQVLRVKNVEVSSGVEILAGAQIPIANIEIPRALKSAAAAEAKAATKGGKKK
jgi:large subunit ribosomal protein L25